ncbi:MAG: MoxR family ATPase [Candidatus Omnitrophica bacterium]|nr:MoxR family ATPase [Candidatus Omnitrophota bacterium]
MQEKEIFAKVDEIIQNIEKVILGKHEEIRLAVAVFLAEGHLLMEDVPGMGKTMLAKSMAKSFSGNFRRIQFTPDLLPSDVTGSYIYNQKTAEFEFRPGPVFANIVIADEINRGTPRTQSSLLEPMEEYQVTADGKTFKLERPFFLIATQNPVEREGTYFLPVSQLDRFLVKMGMGYPQKDQEVKILLDRETSDPLEKIDPVVSKDQIIEMQNFVKTIKVDSRIYEYIVEITQMTRESDKLILGVSPRASLDLFRLSQSLALLEQRNYCIPDDVKKAAPLVLSHRIIPTSPARTEIGNTQEIIKKLVNEISVPIQ